MVYPKSTPLPDEEPPKPDYGSRDGEDGGDTVPDHGLVGEYAEGVRHQAEHNGASYRMKHMRSAPAQEYGSSTEQGRLFRPAVPYADQRVGEVPQAFTQTPNGEQLQYADDMPNGGIDPRQMQVRPGMHPVYFPRGRGEEPPPVMARTRPDPTGPTRPGGRTIYGGPHRTDQRY